MAFRFIGNKTELLDTIGSAITDVVDPSGNCRVVDLFSGTASVSAMLRDMGFQVVANDLLLSCAIHARARLLPTREPRFEHLCEHVSLPASDTLFAQGSTYGKILSNLNQLPGEKGFFYREYSPDGGPVNGEAARNYFMPQNARRIDAIRKQLRTWREDRLTTPLQHAVLLHDLMLAVNKVANTAGTYGHFLAHMSRAAKQPLQLTRSTFTTSPVSHWVVHGKAENLARSLPADVYYLDPPYTKRQYAAYYHILETIAHEDEPALIGKSGLRPWKDRASDFCYKRRATQAMQHLVDVIDARHIFISYSEDGHIEHKDMMDLLSQRGHVELVEIVHPRYCSQDTRSGSTLTERLYRVDVQDDSASLRVPEISALPTHRTV